MLGAKLRVIRKQNAYTLAEVGNRTGLSVSFLSDIERGRTQPSLDTLEKLANCYQVPLSELLDSRDSNTSVSKQVYPPGFDEFLKDTKIEPELIDLLLNVAHRATQPAKTKEDWLRYYYSLKTILGC